MEPRSWGKLISGRVWESIRERKPPKSEIEGHMTQSGKNNDP